MGTLRTPPSSGRRFTSLDRAVLRLRFGGRVPRRQEEVARLLGVSAARVKRIEERALRHLRLTALESAAGPPTEGAIPGWPADACDDELHSLMTDLAHNEWEEA